MTFSRVPHPGCMVRAGSDNALAIGRERRAKHWAIVRELGQKMTISDVPNPRCMVMACGDDKWILGRKLSVLDHVVVAQSGQQPAIESIPHALYGPRLR